MAAARDMLRAAEASNGVVMLEGEPLTLGDRATIPRPDGHPNEGGSVSLPPASWAFVELPEAGAPACG